MYETFFGVKESPFNDKPDLRYFFDSPGFDEAFASLVYGITKRSGLVVFSGENGTGKTTLLLKLADQLHLQEDPVAFLLTPRLSPDQFLHIALVDFGIRHNPEDQGEMLAAFKAWLLQTSEQGHTATLIIDDAHTSLTGLFEGLRLLTNLETSSEKALQIIVAGRPEIEKALRVQERPQLRRPTGFWVRTRSLTFDETSAYIAARLRIAGGEAKSIFTSDAIANIHRLSRGIPRLINLICEQSLGAAYLNREKPIRGEKIERLVAQLHPHASALSVQASPAEPPGEFSLSPSAASPAQAPLKTSSDQARLGTPSPVPEKKDVPPPRASPADAAHPAISPNAVQPKADPEFGAQPRAPRAAPVDRGGAPQKEAVSSEITTADPATSSNEGRPRLGRASESSLSWEEYSAALSRAYSPTYSLEEYRAAVERDVSRMDADPSPRSLREHTPLGRPSDSGVAVKGSARPAAPPSRPGGAADAPPRPSMPMNRAGRAGTTPGAIPRRRALTLYKPWLTWSLIILIIATAFSVSHFHLGPTAILNHSRQGEFSKPRLPFASHLPPADDQQIGNPRVPGESPKRGAGVVVEPPAQAEAGATTRGLSSPAEREASALQVRNATRAAAHRPLTASVNDHSSAVGTLQVDSNVVGAEIRVDGTSRERWVTPYRFENLSPGEHGIVVSKNGYSHFEQAVRVNAGGVSFLNALLTPVAVETNISVRHPSSEVPIQGKFHGLNPIPAGQAGTQALRGNPEAGNGKSREQSPSFVQVKQPENTPNVHISTDPSSATVYADDRVLSGRSPISFRLSPGRHTLIIFLSGHRPVRKEIEIPVSGSIEIRETLLPY